MKRLYSFLYSELLLNFLLTYFAFFTIVFSIEFLDKIDDLINLKVTSSDMLQFFLFRFPFIHSQISLYVTIISIMITLNILSQKNEITALLSLGINIKRIFYIVLMFVTVVASISFYNENFIYPISDYNAELLLKRDKNLSSRNLTNMILRNKDGFIFIKNFMPEKNILLNTYIVKINPNNEIETILFAPVTKNDKDQIIADEASIINYKEHSTEIKKQYPLPEIALLKKMGAVSYKLDWLGFNDLVQLIKSGTKFGINVKSYFYQLCIKFINFISFFTIFFLIFPYGFQLGRNKKNIEIIFLGILILLVYTVAKTLIIKIFKTAGATPIIPISIIVFPMLIFGLLNWKQHFSLKKG